MSGKTTDKIRKQIISDYVQCENYSEVARKFNMSVNGIKNIVKADKSVAKLCNEKKQENIESVLSHMDSKKIAVCEIIDKYLERLLEKDVVEACTAMQTATVLGIIIDKFTNQKNSVISISEVPKITLEIKDCSGTDE